ncbi:Protein CBG06074 [Caenorhabditis briggsae]|uniref:Protein CBG06074 n=1 Tax=Caenorhabditis briggsae TaxID=6238 RepID=A8X0Y8_CAEBR|nr:Protein CBG06074 [Caenorhabditis briggsae]CAP26298.2 Protein CBG06074 [Caenorhabditis briggsae]
MSSSEENSDASAPGTPVKSGTPSSRGSSPASPPAKQETTKKKAILSDSDDDSDSRPAPKQLSDSSDDDRRPAGDGHASGGGNLFGDVSGSSDDDSDSEKKPRESDTRARLSDSDAESRGSLNELQGIVMANPDEIEEKEKEEVHDTEMLSGRVSLEFAEEAPYYVRMPNFLSVATHPFDPQHYEEDEDDDQAKMDEEGRTRLKLRVENTLRWRIRKDENGEEIRESNAKIVKWEDGTMSLYLGNEIFDVTLMPLNVNNLPHLYVSQPNMMSAQHVLTHRMNFRPHSTDSQTHRKVTLNMADRSRKNAQVKVMDSVGQNPEIVRRENARKEEESLRAHIRRTQMVRNNFKVRRPNYGQVYSDEEDMPSTSRKGKRKEAPIIGKREGLSLIYNVSYSGASSESEDEGDNHKKSSDSDSDEEYRKRKQQQKKQIVTSDEDSD